METKSVVLDRIVNGEQAVLLLEDEKGEYIVPLSQLPSQATIGSWLQITLHQGEVINAKLDASKTEEARQRVAEKLAQLRQQQRSHFRKK